MGIADFNQELHDVEVALAAILGNEISAQRDKPAEEQAIAQLESDGWTIWGGGECPVDGYPIAQVIMRDGCHGQREACLLRWTHNGSSGDIMRYRVVRQAEQTDIPAPSNLNDAIASLATACASDDDGQVTAHGVLERAAGHMSARAATYDEPGSGERSMGKAVGAFNIITGRDLDSSEGWLLLQLLKDVRLFTADGYHKDSAEDATAYTALMAEAKAAEAALDERLLNAAVADLTK